MEPMHCDGFVCEEKPKALGSVPGDAGRQAGKIIMQMTTFLSHSGHLTQPTNQPRNDQPRVNLPHN